MKIIRDGKEYELTKEELQNAYLEQERLYDVLNIRDNMEGYLNYPIYQRLKNNEEFIQAAADALRENQDENDMNYDAALSAAFEDTVKDFLLPVNRVTIIRACYSENEIWSDDFWVDADKTPTKELFREAVEAFLMTKDGQAAVKKTCNDFNWGDAVMYIPVEIWYKFGIYPFDYEYSTEDMGLAPTSGIDFTRIQVDQNEVLIPDDYLDRLDALQGTKPALSDRIQAAKDKAGNTTTRCGNEKADSFGR